MGDFIYLILLAFAIIACVEIISTILVFVFKDVLHSIIALSDAFIFNAALFLLLEQPILAMLQLFIMIGGISTYLFVGVGSESFSNFKHVDSLKFWSILIVMFGIMSYPLLKTSFSVPLATNIFYIGQSAGIFSSVGIIYLITAMLFGVGIGSIILLKRLGSDKLGLS